MQTQPKLHQCLAQYLNFRVCILQPYFDHISHYAICFARTINYEVYP